MAPQPLRSLCRYCRSHSLTVRAVSGRATLAGFTVNVPLFKLADTVLVRFNATPSIVAVLPLDATKSVCPVPLK